MQLATNGNDARFEAGREAPKVAKYPQCSYKVTLRGRGIVKSCGQAQVATAAMTRHMCSISARLPSRRAS